MSHPANIFANAMIDGLMLWTAMANSRAAIVAHGFGIGLSQFGRATQA
jgi:hypothetical protein